MQSQTESGKPSGPMMRSLSRRRNRKLKWFGHVSRSAGLAKTREKKRPTKDALGGNISKWTRLTFCDALRESEKKSNGGKGLLGP